MPTTTMTAANGIDTEALSGLEQQLADHPEGGRASIQATSRWQTGGRVFTRYDGYRIDGEMHHQDEREFVLLADEPTELGMTDAAPSATETLLHSLGACIIATTNLYATRQGIELTRLEVTLEGDLDFHGLFGTEGTNPGLQQIRADVTVGGDAQADTLRDLVNAGLRFSPVRNTLERGVPIEARTTVT